MTIVAISQSNYIPWRGYFSQIEIADKFVFLDNVQFTKRDWRTRNQILTPQGPVWLNIPVVKPESKHAKINDISIQNFNFIDSHIELIRRNYTQAKFFHENWEWLVATMTNSFSRNLSEFNINLIKEISYKLDCDTKFYLSTDFRDADDATQRLLNICKDLGATKYLSGPTAKKYLDISHFHKAGIEVIWANYDFKAYKQIWNNEFKPNVSILDAILSTELSQIFVRNKMEI